jgi:hypothetical protein
MCETGNTNQRISVFFITDATTKHILQYSSQIQEEIRMYLPTSAMKNMILDSEKVTIEESMMFRNKMKDIMGDQLISKVWLFVANFRNRMLSLKDLDYHHRRVIYHFVALYCHIYALEDFSWDQNDMYNILYKYDARAAQNYQNMIEKVNIKRKELQQEVEQEIAKENENKKKAIEEEIDLESTKVVQVAYKMEVKYEEVVTIVRRTVDRGLNAAVVNEHAIIVSAVEYPMDKEEIQEVESISVSTVGERLLSQSVNNRNFFFRMRQVSRYWRSQWLKIVRKKQKKLYNYIEDRKCPFHGDLDCEICRVEYFINDKIKMYYEPPILIVSTIAEITHVELIYHF